MCRSLLVLLVTACVVVNAIHVKNMQHQMAEQLLTEHGLDMDTHTHMAETEVHMSDLHDSFESQAITSGKCYHDAEEGTCISPSQCKTRTVSGLCPGKSTKCCITGLRKFGPNGNLGELVPIDHNTINKGLRFESSKQQIQTLGEPGCPMTKECFSCACAPKLPLLKGDKMVTEDVGPFRLHGLKPFVAAVRRAFEKIKAEKPDVYEAVSSAGGFCCRSIKTSKGEPAGSPSNHSWGMAIDMKIYGKLDTRGDGKTQKGLLLMAPYFNAEKLYWGAGYRGKAEDAMHFEASKEAIEQWKKNGDL